MKTAMGIATKNLAASGDESLLGARLRANCDQARVQSAEKGDRPAATRASAPDARSGQCPDLTRSRPRPLSAIRHPMPDRSIDSRSLHHRTSQESHLPVRGALTPTRESEFQFEKSATGRISADT